MCVFRACNLCSDQAHKHVQGFFIWVSYHDEHERALAARASTQICHGACGSCPCRSRPLRLCVPADPVPAPITWRLLLIITFKRILPMQLLHMRLRHPQQLLVHAPIATYYQYPRAIPVSAAPELQLYILLHFRRRGERGDGITNLTVGWDKRGERVLVWIFFSSNQEEGGSRMIMGDNGR